MRLMTILGAGIAMAGAAAPAPAASPAPPRANAAPPAAPIISTPEQAWASVRGAYGAVPTGERVTVTVVAVDGSSKGSESFDVRLDPRPGNAAGPRVRLDLGFIRLVAGDGRVVAAHKLSREGAFVAEGLGPSPAAALRSLIPPLPLPALAALTDGALPADAAGYIHPIEWTDVVNEANGGRAILGRGPGDVKARVVLAANGRVRSLALTDIPGGGSITAAFGELPARPATGDFDLGADGWKRVGSIRELFLLPQTPVDPGQEIPELAVQTPEGEPLVLNEALAKVAPARVTRQDGSVDVELDPPAAERIVLILHRLPVDPAACGVPSASVAAARAALADILYRSQRDRFLARAVADGDPAAVDKAHLPPVSGAIVLVADLGEGNAPARLDQGERALASGDLPRAHAGFAPPVFEAASIAGVIGPFTAQTSPGETLLVTATRGWRLVRAEAWPADLKAAQGAALIEKRLREQ